MDVRISSVAYAATQAPATSTIDRVTRVRPRTVARQAAMPAARRPSSVSASSGTPRNSMGDLPAARWTSTLCYKVHERNTLHVTFFPHAAPRDCTPALRPAPYRTPAGVPWRGADEPHTLHLPDDPDHRIDRRGANGGIRSSQQASRARTHVRLRVRTRSLVRDARADRGDERDDVRRGEHQPVAAFGDGESAHPRRARD